MAEDARPARDQVKVAVGRRIESAGINCGNGHLKAPEGFYGIATAIEPGSEMKGPGQQWGIVRT
jgi:hypothetical protein